MTVLFTLSKPMLREYLHYLFAYEDGSFSVFRGHDFGKLLCSLVQYSNLPVPQKITEHTIKLTLPISRPTANAPNYYLYYKKEDEAKLADYLEAIFNIDLDRYYLKGIKQGYQQKEVIQTFIISRKLVGLIGDNERLKKRLYRDEQKQLKQATDKLLKKVYYRHHQIEYGANYAY
ncbi:MAG TPA: hypothetical protein VKZ95_03455 [Sphingobacteriaceae bacterium]|nr:hypothetical protein [Sphingobacteriaceae bacterium]